MSQRYYDISKIRNFCIVAHIDHGKSTLSDRLLEKTNILSKERILQRPQALDTLELERERGITIKAHPVAMKYESFTLNLIDTPGHVDFSWEVSRSVFVTEGVILLIDVSQGVEAQTLAHANLVKELNKTIIPVINKIDLPNTELDWVLSQIETILGIKEVDEVLLVSAKEGWGIDELLNRIVEKIPHPTGKINAPLSVFVFDSWFDLYKGVVMCIRVVDGVIEEGMSIKLYSNQKVYTVEEVGILQIKRLRTGKLYPGEVGYITAGIKQITDVKVGDRITDVGVNFLEPIPGYKELHPMVFCSLYPADGTEFEKLKLAMDKLRLNDTSWSYQEERSLALGLGFRCGFLGLLHSEIIQQRLEREYDLEVIVTAPRVAYKIHKKDKTVEFIDNPGKFPQPHQIQEIFEPYIKAIIITPLEYLNNVVNLLKTKTGHQVKIEYTQTNKVVLIYELAFMEILYDFYDKLKSVSRGYASFDYEPIGYKPAKIVKIDILIAGELIDELSFFSYPQQSYQKAQTLLNKLRKLIPRQQFQVSLQAARDGKIIARENIAALHKDVTAKCYGGDVTRKRKLLERQKEGKHRLKHVGRIKLPHTVFKALLEI